MAGFAVAGVFTYARCFFYLSMHKRVLPCTKRGRVSAQWGKQWQCTGPQLEHQDTQHSWEFPYKPKIVVPLIEHYKVVRVQFCKWLLNQEDSFCQKVIWNDEKMWEEKTRPNKQNERYWGLVDPEVVDECRVVSCGPRSRARWPGGSCGTSRMGPPATKWTWWGCGWLTSLAQESSPGRQPDPGLPRARVWALLTTVCVIHHVELELQIKNNVRILNRCPVVWGYTHILNHKSLWSSPKHESHRTCGTMENMSNFLLKS